MIRRLPFFILGLACVGCGAPTPHPAEELTIYSAASLRDAVRAAADAYAGDRPGLTIRLVTGSSAALRVQIEQGAPADLYLAADDVNAHALQAAGLAAGPPLPFAANHLALVVPAGNPGGVHSAADLGNPGMRIVAAGERVPISGYTRELLDRLRALPGYPADLPERYAGNVVSREDDVRAVLAKIELGEGDAAIVYATDIRASEAVQTVTLPEQTKVIPTYSGVVLRDAAEVEAARAFLGWLRSPEGLRVIETFGFTAPP